MDDKTNNEHIESAAVEPDAKTDISSQKTVAMPPVKSGSKNKSSNESPESPEGRRQGSASSADNPDDQSPDSASLAESPGDSKEGANTQSEGLPSKAGGNASGNSADESHGSAESAEGESAENEADGKPGDPVAVPSEPAASIWESDVQIAPPALEPAEPAVLQDGSSAQQAKAPMDSLGSTMRLPRGLGFSGFDSPSTGDEAEISWDRQGQPWNYKSRAWTQEAQEHIDYAGATPQGSFSAGEDSGEFGYDAPYDVRHDTQSPSASRNADASRDAQDHEGRGYTVIGDIPEHRAAYYGYGSRSTDKTHYLQTSQVPRRSYKSRVVAGVLAALVVAAVVVLFFEWDDLRYVLPQLPSEAEQDAQMQEKLESEYAYSTLGAEDQKKYRTMLRAIQERTKLAYPVYDLADATRIEAYVKADHPELEDIAQFCLWEGGVFTPAYIGGFYYVSEAQQSLLQTQVNAMAEQCLQEVPEGADDYTKAKTVYDWIANTTEYNKQAAATTGAMDIRESQDSPGTIASDSSIPRDYGQTVANVLLDHNAVCAGYARAFQMLMQKQGVQCVYVRGTVEGESHAWCVAKLDGEYYHIDPTWGDPQYGEVDLGTQLVFPVDYNYFCVTTEDIQKSHAIESVFPVPECTAMDDNYYIRENLYFDQPDAERLGKLVSAVEPGTDTVLVRCADEGVFRTLLDDYVESGRLRSYITSGAYRFGSSEDPYYLVAVMPL